MTYHVVARPGRSREADFDLHMQANRSLTPPVAIKVMVGRPAVLLAMAARFILLGAWPVAMFALFDIALLGGALVMFQRRPPEAEQLSLRDGNLVLHRSDGRSIVLPAYWARLEAVEPSPLDLTLWLRFRDERYPLATCLGLAERREVCRAVERALRALRK